MASEPARIELPADATAPRAARAFVATRLGGALTGHDVSVLDHAVVVVSELVTNSVRADARLVTVEVHVDDQCVELVVGDDAGGWPTQRVAGPDDVRGRGLAIVERLADSWTTTGRDGGKSVTVTWQRDGSRVGEQTSG